MEPGVLIIGFILTAICFLPITLSIVSRKNKEKRLWKSIIKRAQQDNIKISQYDFCGEIVIGLDDTSNTLFFANVKDVENAQEIRLDTIKSSQILNNFRTYQSTYGMQKITEKLELILTPVAPNTPNFILEFYSAEVSIQLNGELQLIEKWEKIIKDRLPVATQKAEKAMPVRRRA